jgi:hypothetical protein
VRYHPATRDSVALATESGLPAMDITALAVQGTDLWVLPPAWGAAPGGEGEVGGRSG